jgi:hypothetical protein
MFGIFEKIYEYIMGQYYMYKIREGLKKALPFLIGAVVIFCAFKVVKCFQNSCECEEASSLAE